jgi:type II secretory pathway component PulF
VKKSSRGTRRTRKRQSTYPILLFTSATLIFIAGHVVLIMLVPMLRDSYRDADIALPEITVMYFNGYDWLMNAGQSAGGIPGWLLAVPVVAVAFLIMIAIGIRLRWMLALFAVPLIGVTLAGYGALIYPYFDMLQTLGGGGGGL